jgi:hypothetical protein
MHVPFGHTLFPIAELLRSFGLPLSFMIGLRDQLDAMEFHWVRSFTAYRVWMDTRYVCIFYLSFADGVHHVVSNS